MKRLAWNKAGQSEGQLRESLILALLDSGDMVTLQDSDSNYLFIANLPDVWTVTQPDLPTDEGIFGAEIAERLANLKTSIIEPGQHGVIEAQSGDRFFEFKVFVTANAKTERIIKTTIREVTSERRREQLLRSLLREVSHRSKNLLAIIQSLASQTARFSTSSNDFLRKFRGRLHALSQSQDLITDSDWRGARIFDLLHQQTNLYLPEYPDLIVTEGENLLLGPSASLYIGLAFHELVVNTVSHSNASANYGPIVLRCTRTRDGDIDHACVEWLERVYKAKADKPRPNGNFGSIVLEKVVPSALSGRAQYNVSPEGISYNLNFVIPPQNVEV